jgi:hypothetical protein
MVPALTADERGMVKTLVEKDGVFAIGDDGNLLIEVKSGHVVCLVYRPE